MGRGTAIEALGAAAPVKAASNRSFGSLLVAIAALVALYALLKGLPWIWWPIAIGWSLTAITLLAPNLLAPFNRAWMWLGLTLGKVITPIIMGLIFFGVLTPIAWLARARGADPLRRRFDPAAKSYWIIRAPPGPDAATMGKQS